MSIEMIMQIIYITLIALSLLSSILTIIIKYAKNGKLKTKAQNAYTIVKKIQDLIINAESFVNYTGKEKINFVITRMKEFSLANNLSLDESYITELVEDEIKLSKNVNAKKQEQNVSRETLL